MTALGGYDDQLDDNVNTLQRLRELCDDNLLSHYTVASASPDQSSPPADTQVLFVLNFTNAQRSYLLTSPNTLCLLYTPSNEHFGIVPIEAGACGLPVLATNSGGPLETILDPETGRLRRPTPEIWAEALGELVSLTSDDRRKLGDAARRRVNDVFTLKKLGEEMEGSCREAIRLGDVHTEVGDKMIWGGLSIMAASGVALGVTLWLS